MIEVRVRDCPNDTAAKRLANELNADLKSAVPDGKYVTLILSPPILEYQKTKAKLRNEITSLLTKDDGAKRLMTGPGIGPITRIAF